MPDATFACPDLTTFCRLDELGLVVFGQRRQPDRAVLACRVLKPDEWCRRCGCQGSWPGSPKRSRVWWDTANDAVLETGGFKPQLHRQSG